MDDKRQMPPPQPPAHYIGDKGRYVAHFDQRGKVTAVYLNGRLISKKSQRRWWQFWRWFEMDLYGRW